MLNILIRNVDDTSKYIKITDNEAGFGLLDIKGDTTERDIISLIDMGEYVSSSEYKDKFGRILPISTLSTGCKTALQCYHNPTKLIDTIECYSNAIEVIIALIRNGNILVSEDIMRQSNGIGLEEYDSGNIDIAYDGQRFKSIASFNDYLYYGGV